MKLKNILTIIFVIFGLFALLEFRDHNQKRAIDACVAGSQKIEQQPMTVEEAKKFCKEKIK
tara:strand:+ start:43 stop:225 length:183 start_codon:yes stop_codon:yes gene_type:complete